MNTIHPQQIPVWKPVPAWRQPLHPPTQWAERACGPDPTGTCCCRASSEDHFFFRGLPRLPLTGTGTSTPAVAQAPKIPAASPESPATTTPTSGETMLPGESHEWQDNDGEALVTEPAQKKGERTYRRLELRPPDFEIPEFGGGPHRKMYPFRRSSARNLKSGLGRARHRHISYSGSVGSGVGLMGDWRCACGR